MSLDVPQLFLGFSCLSVSVAQLDFHLVEVRLHLFFDSHGVVFTACLSVQSGLQSFCNALVVSFHLLHLLVFLGQTAVHLSFDLTELQLDT